MLSAQVFVVGEKTATSDFKLNFKPTNLELPTEPLNELGRRELVRDLEAEQGFAHVPLPMGPGLTLQANGDLSPDEEHYRHMIYEKGQAAATGDRVVVTAIAFKGDRIIVDLNGGPYAKHRFLRHVELNDAPVVQDTDDAPTGARVTLVFKGGVPQISAPEVKSLLQPVIDFGVKTSEEAYANTLPEPIKKAIATHQVLVGMNHRMVLASMGAPESKIREQQSGDPNGGRYEEWIYGHAPQTVRFVRFVGDRVTVVEIAELGKPLEIHDKDEMGAYAEAPPTREIALGDKQSGEDAPAAAPPTLHQPGDAPETNETVNTSRKVQFPEDKRNAPQTAGQPSPGSASDGSHLL
ncbi:MAG: hypothetical protein KGK08_12750 [Acidobacteriota bacterium]|nr:hypothetical protein [Acidobacteriota bacterium]